MNAMNMYEEFLGFCEEQGLEFPCTAAQFIACAQEFARVGGWNEEVTDALCKQGIGQNWEED